MLITSLDQFLTSAGIKQDSEDTIKHILINYKCFEFTFGLTSASLCYPAQKELCPVYSLLKIISHKSSEDQKKLKNYISSYSDNKIIFESETIDYFLN